MGAQVCAAGVPLPSLKSYLRPAEFFIFALPSPPLSLTGCAPPLQVYHAKERAVDLQAELSHVQAALAVAQAAEAGALQAAAAAAGAQVRSQEGQVQGVLAVAQAAEAGALQAAAGGAHVRKER